MTSTAPPALPATPPASGARVSIIMPTHNRAHMIGESIASALSQTLPPYEIIVVDDGSSDDTPAIIAGFGTPVRYLWQRNAGKSAAMNRGIAAAQGDYLMVLDDDDLLPAGALAAHIAALEGAPGAGFS